MSKQYLALLGVIGGVLVIILVYSIVWLVNSGTNIPTETAQLAIDGVEPARESRPTQTPIKTRVASQADSNVVSLGDTLKFESDFDQTVALYNLLAGADEELVKDLLVQTREISKVSQRHAAISIIYARYAAINPKNALEHAQNFDDIEIRVPLRTIFHHWARSNLSQASEAVKALDPRLRRSAVQTMLYARDDLPVGQREALLDDLDMSYMKADLRMELALQSAREDPRSAWQEVLSVLDKEAVTPKHIRQDEVETSLTLLSQISSLWIEQSGLDAMEEMYYSIENNPKLAGLSGIVIRPFFWKDPATALLFLKEHPGVENVEQLMQEALDTYARQDPEAALEAYLEIEWESDSRFRAHGLVRALATKDPVALLQRSDSLPSDIRLEAKVQAIRALAKKDYEQAIDYVDSMVAGPLARNLKNQTAEVWAEDDPVAALEWVLEDGMTEGTMHQMHTVILRIVEEAPEKLLQIASKQEDIVQRFMVRTALPTIAEKDPDLAVRYLSELKGEVQIHAISSVGQKLASTDPELALSLASILPKDQQANYESIVLSSASYGNPHEMYYLIMNARSKRWHSQAALSLIWNNRDQGFLTNSQVEKLKSRLNAKDLERLTGY
ncbi:MAG: hypothetical protein OXC80_11920 [Gammaproteobacteria bacterium]|nr:hypothetical protein [Gammaproteobacteria bacterium]